MRYVWAIIGSIAVVALAAVSAMANWTFGLSLGTDEPITAFFGYVTTTSAQFFGNASLAADVLKCTMFFGVTIGLRSKTVAAWTAGIVCAVIWAVCLAWSVQSAIGFVALNHQRVIDGAGKTADAWGDAADKMSRLKDQRNLVPVHREQSIVQADIEAKRAERLFDATDNCRDFRGKAQTTFCQQYRGLLAEEASAASAIALDTQIEKLRLERDGRKKVSVADPLAVSLARLTSTSTGDVSTYRSWIFAFIVEFVSAFGLWAIWTSLGNSKSPPRETKRFDFRSIIRKAAPVTPLVPNKAEPTSVTPAANDNPAPVTLPTIEEVSKVEAVTPSALEAPELPFPQEPDVTAAAPEAEEPAPVTPRKRLTKRQRDLNELFPEISASVPEIHLPILKVDHLNEAVDAFIDESHATGHLTTSAIGHRRVNAVLKRAGVKLINKGEFDRLVRERAALRGIRVDSLVGRQLRFVADEKMGKKGRERLGSNPLDSLPA